MATTGAYLTWLAFGAEDPHYTGQGFFINAFAAVNGGYFVGFGGTFGHDWEVINYTPTASHPAPPGNADGLATKLAWQTLSGVALGWMNDGSSQHKQPVPNDAGEAGSVNWLMKPAGSAETAWLRRLIALRRATADPYIVLGRRGRDVVPANGSAASRLFGPMRLPSLQAQAWIAKNGSSMAVLVAATRVAVPEMLRLSISARDVATLSGGSSHSAAVGGRQFYA